MDFIAAAHAGDKVDVVFLTPCHDSQFGRNGIDGINYNVWFWKSRELLVNVVFKQKRVKGNHVSVWINVQNHLFGNVNFSFSNGTHIGNSLPV